MSKLEVETGREEGLGKRGRKMFWSRKRKRSQEVKEKEGRAESRETGNKAEGKGRIRGEENRKAGYNAAVVSVSCVPPSSRPDWPVKEPGLREAFGNVGTLSCGGPLLKQSLASLLWRGREDRNHTKSEKEEFLNSFFSH